MKHLQVLTGDVYFEMVKRTAARVDAWPDWKLDAATLAQRKGKGTKSMTIKENTKYQTRNGRIVVIQQMKQTQDAEGNELPPYGEGVLLPPSGDITKGEGDRWSLYGSYKNGTLGVPNSFDLVMEAGKA